MPWKRITINLEPELADIAKKRAKAKRQSVASYFASLLEQDIAQSSVGESKQASYGKPVNPNAEIHLPPKPETKKKAS